MVESSLFDDFDGGDLCHQAGESPAALWQEVPQARFNSWPLAQQLAYCIARDLDAAAQAETLEENQFFQQRAAGYHDDQQAAANSERP